MLEFEVKPLTSDLEKDLEEARGHMNFVSDLVRRKKFFDSQIDYKERTDTLSCQKIP